jgi:hypothetical protein
MSLLKELEKELRDRNYKHEAPTELNLQESRQTLLKTRGRLCGQ